MYAYEAIDGHRVRVSNHELAEELRDATGVVISSQEAEKLLKFGPPGKPYVCIRLDEPFASRWEYKVICLLPESLEHAPTYEMLVMELEILRESHSALVTESDKLARGLREAKEQNSSQAQRLAEQYAKVAELDELHQQAMPTLRKFSYEVESTTELYKWYTIEVYDNEVVSCSCLGWYFNGHCKHANQFTIPMEARMNAERSRQATDAGKQLSILRQIAELAQPFLR